MNRVKNPLFQWSLTLALLSGFLARVLLQPEEPLFEMSLGMRQLAGVLLLIVPLIGIILGALSWKRKELKVGWSIVVVVLNAVEFLLILLLLSALYAG